MDFFKNLFLTGKKHESGRNIVKTVVLIIIGAILYGIGGMIRIVICANIPLKPAMGILALFAAAYGPIVGIFSGFLGHILTDLFMDWGIWVTWAFGSALVGLGLGLYPIITKKRLDDGIFGCGEAGILILMSLVANFVGYLVSALLDHWSMGEPLEITRQLLVSVANTTMIAIVGCLLMKLVAFGNKASLGNRPLEENAESPQGKSQATASLVLGIISVVLWFFGWASLLSVVLGIIGLVLATKAKALGFDDGIRTAGFVLSLISLVGGAVFFVLRIASVGLLAFTLLNWN